MKEDFFRVGYSSYLKQNETKKQKWTSRFLSKILEHKVIFVIMMIIFLCAIINFWLIFKFMNIIEVSGFMY